MIAAGFLLVVLAVLAGLFYVLSISADHAAVYAAAVFAISGCAIWLVGRHNGNFRRWRALVRETMAGESRRQAWALANRDLPRVKRQSRLIGLALTAAGVLMAIAIAAALIIGDLTSYRFTLFIPLVLLAAGLWMLVTGRQPDPRRGKAKR